MNHIRTVRVGRGDRDLARETFEVMAEAFGEGGEPLPDDRLDDLLRRDSFWAFAALAGRRVVGGVTAHVLPMTRSPSSELFVYDLAVHVDHRRQGIARRLISDLLAASADAGIETVFVPAEGDDEDALAFYRGIGGDEEPVSFFTFDVRGRT